MTNHKDALTKPTYKQAIEAIADGDGDAQEIARQTLESNAAQDQPSIEALREMAYLLRLVPRGNIVAIQLLEVLKQQYNAALQVAKEFGHV